MNGKNKCVNYESCFMKDDCDIFDCALFRPNDKTKKQILSFLEKKQGGQLK